MPKIPEKLSILLGVGDTLLARLHKIKVSCSDSQRKPSFLTDPQSVRLINNCTKKFQNGPDLNAIDSILSSVEDKYEELEDYYFTFIDVSKFLDSTKLVIEEITSSIAAFQFDKNPVLTEAFLDVVTILVRTLLMMNLITDRKNIVTVFAALYKKKNQQEEENWKSLVSFIHSYEQPIRTLQQSLDPSVAEALGHALIELSTPITSLHSVDQMRKTGVLSITNKPNEMCYPLISKQQLMMRLSPKIYMWIVYCFLLTPEQFAMPEAMEVLKFALKQSYVAPLYLNEVYYIHSEYELLFSSYKSQNKVLNKQFKKEKKNLSEILSQSVQATMGPKFRSDRRTFIRHELQQLLLLSKDYPGLLGPKIGVIWSTLSMAKEEVFWYFSQRINTPPKGVKGYQEKLYSDPYISELIYYMEEMASLIRQYSYIIQQYYLEYLSGADLNQAYSLIQNLLQKGASGPVAEALNSIIQDLQNISIDAYLEGTDYSFRALRLNWFRVESWLVTPGCPAGDIHSNAELTKRMNLIMHHTKNVDAIEYLLWDYESLHGLYYFGDEIIREIDNCINSLDTSLYLRSWIGLISKFPESVGLTNEEEKPLIGERCVTLANNTLEKIVNKISEVINSIGNSYINFGDQLDPVKASSIISPEPVQGQIKYTISSNILVGSESRPKNHAKLENLPNYKHLLAKLCSVIKSFEAVYVYSNIYNPIVYLNEKLKVCFEQFLIKSVRIPPLDKEGSIAIQRPSVLIRKIEMFKSALQLVGSYTLLDVSGMIQEVLTKLTYHPLFENEDALSWVNETTILLSEQEYPFLYPFIEFYTNLVLQRMEYGVIIYSPKRESFICKNYRAEEYCSIVEFEALAKLIGTNGIQLIDKKLLDTIRSKLEETKNILRENEEGLTDLETFYTTDSCIPYARKLIDIESFTLKGFTIGNCLVFRNLLYKGLQAATKKLAPVLYKSSECLFNQYKRNIFGNQSLRNGDLLALHCGVDVDFADSPLQIVFKSIQEEDALVDLWKLLPYFFASCTFTSAMQNAIYKPSLDVFTNNAHVLIDTFITMMVLCRSTCEDDEEFDSIRRESIEKYLECASIILVRLLRINVKDLQKKLPFASLQSAVVFLDMVVNKANIPKSTLDNITPYSLMRSLYHEIYLSNMNE